jgi:hypothetical protein
MDAFFEPQNIKYLSSRHGDSPKAILAMRWDLSAKKIDLRLQDIELDVVTS